MGTASGSLDFSGSSSVISGSTGDIDMDSSPGTILTWFNWDNGSPASESLFHFEGGGAGFRFTNNPHIVTLAFGNTDTIWYSISTGTWGQVGMSWSSTDSGTVTPYNNAVAQSTFTDTPDDTASRQLIFGTYNSSGPGQFYDGRISRFQYYTSELSAEEINETYHNPKAHIDTLNINLEFMNPTTATQPDHSGNGKNLSGGTGTSLAVDGPPL